MVLGMRAWPARDRARQDARRDVTLHDIAGGLASGIALLRGMAERPAEVVDYEFELALTALEPQVRRLRALISGSADPQTSGRGLDEMVQREARILGLDLELEVAGEGLLTPAQRRLIELT